MKFATAVRLGSLALFPWVAAGSARAQQSVTCESNNGKRNYCGSYTSNQVTLQRQIGQSPCERGRSWGVDGRGLWVDYGCRAVFNIRYALAPPPGGPPAWWTPAPGDPWPPSGGWHGGNWGHGGICVCKQRNFAGALTCFRRGDRMSSLAGFGDKISSIRVFGGARVTVYNDRNFPGPSSTTARDIVDLRNWSVPGMGNHTWNNRISSLKVY